MKRGLIVLFLLINAFSFAQSPEKISYQAVVRNGSKQLVVNQTVGLKISILQGSTSGTVVYSETQTPNTNSNGLVSVEIGGEEDFSSIDWNNGPYYIKTETDINGGTNYTIIGISQLLSVPYALHAKTVSNVDYNSITNRPLGNAIGDIQYWNGTAWQTLSAGTPGQVLVVNQSNVPVWKDPSEIFMNTKPLVSLQDVSDLQMNSVSLNGKVNANGFLSTVVFEIGTTTDYGRTIEAEPSLVSGRVESNVTSLVNELLANKTYHCRLKATNAIGITYSGDVSFTTPGQAPKAITNTADNITTTTVTFKGIVNANGFAASISFEYGETTSYGNSVEYDQNPLDGNIDTEIGVGITGLDPGKTYHYRIKAINTLGTTYGDDFTFTTLGLKPTATTIEASDIALTSVLLKANINANLLETTVSFEYGKTTSYGNTVTLPQTYNYDYSLNVSQTVESLLPGTLYHYRVKATNILGSTYGDDMTFTTLGQAPTVETLSASKIKSTSTTLNGTVNANLVETTVTFEYGTTTSYGNSVSAIESPVTGDNATNVSAAINGLTIGTTYHYRIKAENSVGTTYGNDMTFTYLYFGANYQGGLIFYIDETGMHGLVCAPTDQSTGAEWGCNGTTITGADGYDVGTGYQNTLDIINGCSTPGTAARICYDLTLNGYDDWYLPSYSELGLVLQNIKKAGLGDFTEANYWCSTEFNNMNAYAWEFTFIATPYEYGKAVLERVRAIRSF